MEFRIRRGGRIFLARPDPVAYPETMSGPTEDLPPRLQGALATRAFRKLRRRILRQAREAPETCGMIRRDARWRVSRSGGQDSCAPLAAPTALQWRGLPPVELPARNIARGRPGFAAAVLPEFREARGVPRRIERRDAGSVVASRTPQARACGAVRSRLRRGNLSPIAREEGWEAAASGRPRDDVLEIVFMNLFPVGRPASMPPKRVGEAGDLIALRPLAHVAEADSDRVSRATGPAILPCDLCGGEDGLQRLPGRAMPDARERNAPGRRQVMFRAGSHAGPLHPADRGLFDVDGLRPAADPAAEAEGEDAA